MKHEFKVLVPDDGTIALECVTCQWISYPFKEEYRENIESRHNILSGWWPYTEHGKPEKVEDGIKKIDHDWPNGEAK